MEQNLRDIWMNSFPIANELANGSLRLTEYKGQYYLWSIPNGNAEPSLLETFGDNDVEIIEQQYQISYLSTYLKLLNKLKEVAV